MPSPSVKSLQLLSMKNVPKSEREDIPSEIKLNVLSDTLKKTKFPRMTLKNIKKQKERYEERVVNEYLDTGFEWDSIQTSNIWNEKKSAIIACQEAQAYYNGWKPEQIIENIVYAIRHEEADPLTKDQIRKIMNIFTKEQMVLTLDGFAVRNGHFADVFEPPKNAAGEELRPTFEWDCPYEDRPSAETRESTLYSE